jgi:phospholipid/cholesterol/gamma-HCH transport system substrate-binding protein
MENRAHALAAGLFVMILSIAVIATAAWFTGDTGTRDKYLVVSESPVTGLNAQATVRYRGVTVGKVENISLDPNNHRVILIRIAVDKNVPLNTKAYAQLGYQGLTGLAFVQLNEESDEGERLTTDPDNPAKIPLRPSALDSITQGGQRLLGKANGLADQLAVLLAAENQKNFSHILENTANVTNRLTAVVNQLEPALKPLPGLAADTGTLLRHTDQLVLNLNDISMRINEQGGPIQSLSQTADDLTDTLQKVRDVAEGIARNSRNLDRVLLQTEEQPRSLLFGRAPPPPGPGEEGFVPPPENLK